MVVTGIQTFKSLASMVKIRTDGILEHMETHLDT
jgi:hypothetical protein